MRVNKCDMTRLRLFLAALILHIVEGCGGNRRDSPYRTKP